MRLAILGLLISLVAADRVAGQDSAPEVRTYKTAAARELQVHVFRPDAAGPAPAILLFHGGGWATGGPDWVHPAANMFRAEGLVAIAVQYRLSGEGTTPADAMADACDAFAWARSNAAELGIDPGRVGGYGVSAGGQLVAAAGTGACGDGKGPELMMLWSPAIDVAEDGWFRRLMKGADPAPFSPLARVASRRPPPTAIIQGAADTLTPLADAVAFCAAAKAAGAACDVHAYPNLGHLLTRNLANQEDDYDPDPEARRDGQAKLKDFLRAQGWTRGPARSGASGAP